MEKIDASLRAVSARLKNFGNLPAEFRLYITDRSKERINDIKEYSSEGPFADTTLYVCKLEDIYGKKKKDLPANLFCYTLGDFPKPDEVDYCNILFCDQPYSTEEILSCTFNSERIFSKNAYSNRILEALYAGSTNELCRVGNEILGNPVVIIGNDNRLIAGNYQDSDSDQINKIIDADSLFFARINFDLMEKNLIGDIKQLPEVSINYCCKKVTVNDLVVAYIVVLEDKVKIAPSDIMILDDLVKAYRVMLFGNEIQTNSTRLVYEYALLRMLTDTISQNSKASERYFEILGYKFKSHLRIIAIDSIKKLENTEVKDFMSATAEQLRQIVGKDGLCTPIRDYVVIFINTETEDNVQHILSEIQKFCIINNMRAGISSAFYKAEDIRRCHRQALDAMAMGTTITPEKTMEYYDKLRIYRMIASSGRSFEASDLIPDCLKKLINYDRKNNTTLVETLEYYIYAVKNSKKAAEMLHIHRNTLLYRLEKIYEIMGENLEEGNLFIELGIAYKVMEFISKQDGRKLCFTPIHLEDEE